MRLHYIELEVHVDQKFANITVKDIVEEVEF